MVAVCRSDSGSSWRTVPTYPWKFRVWASLPRNSSSPGICVRQQKTAVTRSTSILVRSVLCNSGLRSVLVSRGPTLGDWDLGEIGLWLALPAVCIVSCPVPVGSVLLGLCSWLRGSSFLRAFGQQPNRKVVTFTIRRAPRGKQKKRGDSWFFPWKTRAQRCASPERRRPICATGLSL